MTVNEIVSVAAFADLDVAGRKVSISPDGKYVAVVTERASLDHRRLQADVLLWRIGDLNPTATKPRQAPAPVQLARFTRMNGPVIKALRWAGDSRSIVVLVTDDIYQSSLWRLTLAKAKQRVSAAGQNVRSFDVAASTVLYTASAASPIDQVAKAIDGIEAPMQIGTTSSLQDLVFPGDNPDPSEWIQIWRWSGGKPKHIPVRGPFRLSEARNPLALSPDGRMAIVNFPVVQVPEHWGRFSKDTRLDVTAGWKSGPQRFTNKNGLIPHQFQLLDLSSGLATPIADAPDAQSRGILLPSPPMASWSVDGSLVAISATFLPGHTAPCVAVFKLPQRTLTCVTPIEQSLDRVRMVEFSGLAQPALKIDIQRSGESRSVQRFDFNAVTSTWKLADRQPWKSQEGSRFAIRQDLNMPPLLVESAPDGDRTLHDPNPQIDRTQLAFWKTIFVPVAGSNSFPAGLLVPDGPVPAGGFPLIIQTHGFDPTVFSASGIYEAPFAAQAFVKEGFAVIQIPMTCPLGTVEEVPCHLARYKAALVFLAQDKVINLEQVGIIGFSRTAIHVLAALIDPTFEFKAAVLSNGYLNTISQYFQSVNYVDGFVNGWMNKMIGGRPYGQGIKNWVGGSPSFNYDQINTPLRIEAIGRLDTLMMWEPFAAMRDLGKPADLIVFRQGTHPLTNPAERAASQRGTLDWFKYWIKGKSDPSRSMTMQYERWNLMSPNASKTGR